MLYALKVLFLNDFSGTVLMIKREVFFWFSVFFIGIFNIGFSQETEQSYLVCDQPYYITGSNIKYTCYLFNSTGNKGKVSSKIAYVEFLDDNGNTIESHKHDVASGSNPGVFDIADTLSTGWYYLRSYTHFQIDYCEELNHSIPIYVVNFGDELNLDDSKKTDPEIPDFNIYIEGDQLISNSNNTIIVKSKTGKGTGEKLEVWIIDNSTEDSLKQFFIRPDGYGSCTFNAETKSNYKLIVSDKKGSQKIFQFPASVKNVLNVRIDNNKDQSNLIVKLYFEEPFSQFKNLEGFAKGKSKVVKLGKIKVKEGYQEIKIIKNDLESGKNIFQFISGDNEIIAQKTVYIDTGEDNNLFILRSSEEYIPRERIPIQIFLTNPLENKFSGSLSVIVRDSRQFQDFTTGISNIIEYSKISPKRLSYFVESDDLIQSDKNKLLEENFILEDIEFNRGGIKNNTPIHDPEVEIILKGKAIDAETEAPLSVRALTFTQTGESPDYNFQFTGKEGDFEFRDIYFHNRDNELILNIGGNEEITLDSVHLKPAFNPPVIIGDIWKNNEFRNYIQTRLIEQKFLKFFINSRDSLNPQNNLSNRYLANKSYSKPDRSYDLDDYLQLNDMKEVIIELMPNVKIFKIGDQTRIRLFHHANATMLPDPLFLVNGKVVKNNDFILNLDVTNVKNIDIIVRQGKLEEFGAVGSGGVIAIYTKKPIEIPYGTRIDILGYHKPNFIVYQSMPEQLVETTLPDFNPLLYWNPELKFDSNDETTIEFYLNDLTSEFEIIVQGISQSGEAFFDSKKFLVLKPVDN